MKIILFQLKMAIFQVNNFEIMRSPKKESIGYADNIIKKQDQQIICWSLYCLQLYTHAILINKV